MEVIANLQKTMETLNAKLENNGSDTSVTTNSYRKQAKTGQSPRKNKSHGQGHSSDSDSDLEMAKPPDPGKESQCLPCTNDATVMGEASINGGIHNDNTSKTMIHEFEGANAKTESQSDSSSPLVDNRNND